MKYIKIFSYSLYVLLLSPIIIVGFIWQEVVDAFSGGREISQIISQLCNRWWDGNS